MKLIFILVIFFLINSCSKPKTVLICGDHICVNKTEAEQYFEENLTIEVKIIDKKIKNEVDLVELNLKESNKDQRKVTIKSKKQTNKNIKSLSNNEIAKIKKDLKNKKKLEKKIVKKTNNRISNQQKIIINKDNSKNDIKSKKNRKKVNHVNKKAKDIVDVCTILEKCSIDEISKYLLNQGIKKDYPDITTRQ